MPTYDAEILADSPLFYFKCEELSGSTMADSSGNSRDGSIFTASPGPPTFGVSGPIETDATSYGGSGAYGSYASASGSDTDLRVAFTWEVWGRLDELVQDHGLLNRNGSFSSNGSNCLGWNSGAAFGRISFGSGGANTFDLSYSTIVTGAWYHLALVRNAGTMLLYVNGVLRDQRTDLPAGDLVYANFNNGDWSIGTNRSAVSGGGYAQFSQGVSHAAIYASALSAPRILAHYEAAKASLPLRATIVINLGLELNTDQIVPTNLGFPHNYSQTFGNGHIPIVEELEYKTNINKSEPDYEQRISARPHGPLRTLEYHFSPTSGAARARLQGHLYTPGQFYCVPVWSDVGTTTAQANAGTSTIQGDTTKRDYEALSYVGVCTDLQDPNTYQFYQIASGGVADGALTLASTIMTTIPSGSFVFPARVASLSDDHFAVHSFAADHEDTILRFELIESELSTRRITTYTPATTYLSTEVFTLETAKVSFLDDRPFDVARRIQARGRDYQFASDTGSPQVFPVRFLLKDRAALSEFYGWLDQRNGKQMPLWVSTRERDLIPSAGNTTSITVAKTGFSLHHGRRHLEFLKTDGSFTRARVTAITDNLNGTETWTVTSPSFATISKVSFLKYCTLGADLIRIQHYKGNIAECGLSFRELLTSPQ